MSIAQMQEKLVISELEPFILPDSDVVPNGRELGRGAYGSVEEVRIPGALCAAKKLHDQLIQLGSEQQVRQWTASFVNECKLASKLRHPNIVQFLGVCYLPDSPLPVLLMEKLVISLDELLEKEKNIPYDIKVSILIDVSSGLVFLHCRDPPIVHRDLTARNILLDSALTAKIADLGVARMVTIQPGKLAATMTNAPGNIIYMPPETMGSVKTQYNTAVDIFSFGNVSLFTLTQVFQDELLAANYFDSTTRTLIARTEIQRRSQYIDILHSNIREGHPLSKLILQCLEYLPEDRPTATQLLGRLKEIQSNTPQKWDMTKLELIHRVEEARHQHTHEEHQRQLAEKQALINVLQGIIAEKQATINAQQRIINDRHTTISEQQKLIAVKQATIDEQQGIITEKETTIVEQLGIITKKRAIINDLHSHIIEKQSVIDEKDAIIHVKQSEIEYLQQETSQFTGRRQKFETDAWIQAEQQQEKQHTQHVATTNGHQNNKKTVSFGEHLHAVNPAGAESSGKKPDGYSAEIEPIKKPTQKMNQDTEKWPDFNSTPDRTSGVSMGGAKNRTSRTMFVIEMTDSGMYTLRKKKDHQRAAVNGSETLATPAM